jgi:hypothetical protein
MITSRWQDRLRREVLELPNDCHVGNQVLEYLHAVDTALELMGEPDLRRRIIDAASRQCDVWLFG